MNSCEETVNQAAAASRLRFGPAPEGKELVIYSPHPGLHSLYYKADQQTLRDFITESLQGNELLQLDRAHRATRINAVFKNISQCPPDAFPRIVFNDDMFCFTNGVLLLSSMEFYAYDGNINELDVGKAVSRHFAEEAHHPGSDSSRQWLELHKSKAALQASASASAAAASTTVPVPSVPQLQEALTLFFQDEAQPLKITK